MLVKTKRFYVMMSDKMFKSASRPTDFIFYCIILFATLQLTAFKKHVALFSKMTDGSAEKISAETARNRSKLDDF